MQRDPLVDDSMSIAAVIPSYQERPGATTRTIQAILEQSRPVSDLVLVDDGSPTPQLLDQVADPRVRMLRMPANGGISAARNRGVRTTTTDLIACVNIDVLLAPDWLERCGAYLAAHPRAGLVGTRVVPLAPEAPLTQWRMRFHERPFPAQSGKISWLSGHALLIRREAFDAVGGFDETLRLIAEDVDFCRRLSLAGWEVHFLADTVVQSIQEDSLAVLSRKELGRSGWSPHIKQGVLKAAYIPTQRTLRRMVRHFLSGRFAWIPRELRIWLAGMQSLRKFYRHQATTRRGKTA